MGLRKIRFEIKIIGKAVLLSFCNTTFALQGRTLKVTFISLIVDAALRLCDVLLPSVTDLGRNAQASRHAISLQLLLCDFRLNRTFTLTPLLSRA